MNQKLSNSWSYFYPNIDRHIKVKSTRDTIKSLFKEAYRTYSIEAKDLGTRKRKVIDVNTVLCVVIRSQFRTLTLEVIGNIFNKHHATVIHYEQNYENILCSIPEYNLLYTKLTDMCMFDKYGLVQKIKGKSNEWLKSECLRLASENKELKSKVDTIKEFIYA